MYTATGATLIRSCTRQKRYYSSCLFPHQQWVVNPPPTTTTTSPSPPGSASSTATMGYGTPTYLPKDILLVRHGQSLGNVDERLFRTMPDWKIPLSDKGKQQAHDVGKKLKTILPEHSNIIVYVSPYIRTKQTLEQIQESILQSRTKKILFVREEPRLREQDFGNFQKQDSIQQAKKERPQFGRFFYRFPDGESGADVFDRVSAFVPTLFQDLQEILLFRNSHLTTTTTTTTTTKNEEQTTTTTTTDTNDNPTVVLLVTHGITARLFCMRWLHWSVEEFEQLHNPPNCGILHLRKQPDGYTYQLTEESRELIKGPQLSGGALQISEFLRQERKKQRLQNRGRKPFISAADREAFDSLPDTAWGI